MIKNGDNVIAWDEDNGFLMAGKLRITSEHDATEADIEFPDGGSCSPIGLSDCVVVPEWVAKCVYNLSQEAAVDEKGDFVFKEVK